jgi:hypothetical protein
MKIKQNVEAVDESLSKEIYGYMKVIKDNIRLHADSIGIPQEGTTVNELTAHINDRISFFSKDNLIDTNFISDGYHTFGELYEHRIALYIALAQKYSYHETPNSPLVWRSKVHSDCTVWEGWFLLGVDIEPGKQITYHLPISKWDECSFAETLDKAPEFDGHTSADVLERLKAL